MQSNNVNIEIKRIYSPNENELKQLHSIINTSYLNSESEFWKKGYERISLVDLQNLFTKKSIFIGFYNNEIVGCVKITQLNDNKVSYSMLCVDESCRGKGIAKALLNEVEKWAKEKNSKTIQLELLVPQHFIHSDKEKLKIWYSKLGYSMIKTANFEEFHFNLVPLMKIECNFEIWEKDLHK